MQPQHTKEKQEELVEEALKNLDNVTEAHIHVESELTVLLHRATEEMKRLGFSDRERTQALQFVLNHK